VEGETLRERLRSGAIAMRQTLEYALQISQGLAAAHENFGGPRGESVGGPHFPADGNAWAYVYQRVLADAFVVTGLK
jgi:hypothetical protein